jgi:hypothetical protein
MLTNHSYIKRWLVAVTTGHWVHRGHPQFLRHVEMPCMEDWQYFWRVVLLGHTAIPTTVGGSAPTVTVRPVKDVSSLNHQVQKRPTSLGVTECGVRHSKTSVPFAIVSGWHSMFFRTLSYRSACRTYRVERDQRVHCKLARCILRQ